MGVTMTFVMDVTVTHVRHDDDSCDGCDSDQVCPHAGEGSSGGEHRCAVPQEAEQEHDTDGL